MSQIRKTGMRFEVPNGAIVDGVPLPPGRYAGYSKEIGVHMLGGLKWTAPTFHMDIYQATCQTIPGCENLLGMTIDVTNDLANGTIKRV